MVSIVTKKIKGKEYLYLVTSIRNGKKVIQKTVKYIGPKKPVLKEDFECMKISANNKDWVLNEFKDELSYKDHQKLNNVSTKYRKYLENLDNMSREKENEKFLSAFIASSNAIEGSTMNPKETYDFLFNDIVPKNHSKKELFMASNLLDAWKYLEKQVKELPTKKDLFELHHRINKNIESDETLGKFKKVQNYIGDVHTTSYLFSEERIVKLLHWIKKAFTKIDDFEVTFQSHAQFEIIHPFIDGNGRVGRLLINWLLIMKGKMPLAIKPNKRNEYISALENSRRGKIEAICRFCLDEYLKQYEFVI